jgi:hypothetical protein
VRTPANGGTPQPTVVENGQILPLSRTEALAIAELRLVEGSAFEIVRRVLETDAKSHGPWFTASVW